MTPWQALLVGKAAVDAARRRHDLAMAAAWTSAGLARATRLPPLKSLLSRTEAPRQVQPEEAWAGMRFQMELYQMQRDRRRRRESAGVAE